MGSMARERVTITQRFGISTSASNEPHSPGNERSGEQPRGMHARLPAEVVTRFLRNEPNERAKVIVTRGYGRELRAIQSHLSSKLEARDRGEQPPSDGAPSPSATRYLRNEPTAKPYEESREPEQGGAGPGHAARSPPLGPDARDRTESSAPSTSSTRRRRTVANGDWSGYRVRYRCPACRAGPPPIGESLRLFLNGSKEDGGRCVRPRGPRLDVTASR
jgi:hypothetical protein